MRILLLIQRFTLTLGSETRFTNRSQVKHLEQTFPLVSLYTESRQILVRGGKDKRPRKAYDLKSTYHYSHTHQISLSQLTNQISKNNMVNGHAPLYTP